jgi:diamine N-acetyltransferase
VTEHGSGSSSEPIMNIIGEKVALGPVRHDLLATYRRWYNDFGMRRTFGGLPRPWTDARQDRWYEDVATPDDSEAIFTIYEAARMRPVGTTTLTHIDYRNRSAEFGILIGEDRWRGKGFGTETSRLMLDYAFSMLELHSVYLTVVEFNLAGIRAYEKAGFRHSGRRRDAIAMDGRYWDEIYMDCLASEFCAPSRDDLSEPDPQRQPSGN